jgi:type VI secretion system protein ImpL
MRTLAFLLIGLTVLGSIGLVLYWFFGGEEEEETGDEHAASNALAITASEGPNAFKDTLATTTEEYRGSARKSRMLALKESLERSLDSRQGVTMGSAKDRMQMPWFMLVGADGSGKQTILGNTGLPLPWGPPIEVDSHRKDAGKWWLFENAVVLEAPPASSGTTAGTATLPPDQTVADSSVGWSTLLHMLRRERPDSPLNGIIVTISCADLLGARTDSSRMEDQAERIRNFLAKTSRFLGVRLPLHVLVTKCDALPGFRSFVESLPEMRRQDIFGWSNPSDPEAKFETTWVDAGFTNLEGRLADLRDEVLAAPEHVRDSVGVFVFDSEFSDLQEPLKAFVARLVTIGERKPSLFFRGFYFTGDTVDASAAAKATQQTDEKTKLLNSISSDVAGEPRNLVFVKSLFGDKIFKEAGLARPAARLRLARDRRVVLAQAAALIISLVGGSGLWTAVNGFRRDDQVVRAGLRADAEVLTRVLSGVAIDLDGLKRAVRGGADAATDQRARDGAVIELVGQMRDVPSMHMRSVFIPTSWFSPLPDEIKRSMQTGIQDIVLPVTQQRLQERATQLLGADENSAETGMMNALDENDPRTIITYLRDVRTLSRNIARYNSLADPRSGSVAELSALLDYLFGEQIVQDSAVTTRDFEAALERAAGARIVVSPAMVASVVQRAVAVVSRVSGSASRQLAPRITAAAAARVRAEDDLEALKGLGALVELVDSEKGVVAALSDSAILGIPLARAIEDSIRAQLRLAAVRIAPDTVSPDSSAKRLRTVIGQVFSSRLMDRIERPSVTESIGPNERLRWDVGRLELALALRSDFLGAAIALADAFPGQPPERMQRALEVQLRDRTIDVAASAQRFTPVGADIDAFVEVKTQGANLEHAATRLVRLAIALDSLDASDEGRKLIAAAARQAERALAVAQAQFDKVNYLAPNGARIAAWQGVIPIGFAAMGESDSLLFAERLLAHETDIRLLAHNLSPSLRFLRLRLVGDSLISAPRLLSTWEEIATSVAKYERGDLSSSLGALHRYLRNELSMSDLESCRAAVTLPDTLRASTDIFVNRRIQFRAAVVSRCVPRGSAGAVASYLRLRTLFQQHVAGRYPFIDTSSVARIEADQAAVREFTRQYDAFALTGDVMLRSDPQLAQTARAAMLFLDQMTQVRPFLAPYVDGGARRAVPEYAVGVSVRVHPDSVPMEEVEVLIGPRRVALVDGVRDQPWRYGDSVRVVLTPFDTAQTREVFAAGGNWSALRFAQRPPPNLTVTLFHPDTKMEVRVPYFPITAPDILIPRPR